MPNPDPPQDSQTARLVEEHAQFMVRTYNRQPPVFHRGKGCYLWDLDNRQYLDFTAGIAVNGLGHADPGVARVLSQQVGLFVDM